MEEDLKMPILSPDLRILLNNYYMVSSAHLNRIVKQCRMLNLMQNGDEKVTKLSAYIKTYPIKSVCVYMLKALVFISKEYERFIHIFIKPDITDAEKVEMLSRLGQSWIQKQISLISESDKHFDELIVKRNAIAEKDGDNSILNDIASIQTALRKSIHEFCDFFLDKEEI